MVPSPSSRNVVFHGSFGVGTGSDSATGGGGNDGAVGIVAAKVRTNSFGLGPIWRAAHLNIHASQGTYESMFLTKKGKSGNNEGTST